MRMQKRQQEYCIDYEAYRHFAFFAGLLLHSNAPTPTSAVELVKWYNTYGSIHFVCRMRSSILPNFGRHPGFIHTNVEVLLHCALP